MKSCWWAAFVSIGLMNIGASAAHLSGWAHYLSVPFFVFAWAIAVAHGRQCNG